MCQTGAVDPRIARTRERALAAAQDLLVAEGVDAVTHARVAAESGVGRRTLYRHWPDARSLLHATLSLTAAPTPEPGEDLRTSLLTHLRALDEALVRGPLTYVLAALAERAEHDHGFAELRDDLVAAGCAPLRTRLARAAARGELPPGLDVTAALAALEGPIVYEALLHGRSLGPVRLARLVDRFLADPPTEGA